MFTLTPPSDRFYILYPSNAQKFLGNDAEQTSHHKFPLCPSVSLLLHWQNKSLSKTELSLSMKQAKPEEKGQCSQLVSSFPSFPKTIQDIQEPWQKLQLTLPKVHCRLLEKEELVWDYESVPMSSTTGLNSCLLEGGSCFSSAAPPCNFFECLR